MTSEREVALFAYKVGWEPKGWLPGRPWIGVTTPLRWALTTLAGHHGLPVERVSAGAFTFDRVPRDLPAQLGGWTDADMPGLGELNPMSPEASLTLHRVTLGLLEGILTSPAGLSAVNGDALSWQLRGHALTVTPDDLLEPGLPRRVQQQVKAAQAPRRERAAPGTPWLTLGPLRVRLWCMAWLARLQPVIQAGQPTLHVQLLTPDPLAALALWDTLELLEATRRLYGLTWRVPQVTLDVPRDAALEAALRAYQGHPDGPPTRTPLVPLRLAPVPHPDVIIGPLDEVGPDHTDAHWPASDIYAAALGLQRGLETPFREYHVEVAERDVLDFMFSRFFAHAALRDEQFVAVQRTLGGDALLVLLPTGYGKSVVYQLVGLMQPGVALIISPLTALIKDQVAHLRRDGIIGAGYIVGSGHHAKDYEHFEGGRYRLFYCAPERLQTAQFKKTVAGLIAHRRISLVAVDEAHCVSEWGHDFRPAYLHVRSMRRLLQAQTGRPIPLLALTATASPVVRADIQRALGIPDGHVVQSRSSDRPELSFSVHAADGRGGRRARLAALDHVFTHVAPQLFGTGALTRRRADGHYENGAIVFTPYADRRDRELYGSGTSVIREHLSTTVLAGEPVGMYSGTAPGRCPHCGSQIYSRHYGTYHCERCAGTFTKAQIRRDDTWTQEVERTQEAFLADDLNVLVATKGFGMGIDKQNIRLVTHFVMSGSLEAFYQEAGRAGRSGEHAHVALVTVPPAAACARDHVQTLTTLSPDAGLPFPCLARNAKGFHTLKCPYGLTELCDVAQQALFISETFPSAAADHAALMLTHDAVSAPGPFRPPRDLREETLVRALGKLVTLGIVNSHAKKGQTYQVTLNRDWAAAHALDQLEEELRGYDQLTGAPEATLRAVQALRARPALTAREYVDAAGRLLIDTLYSTVRTMRLYGLVNLYRFATLPAGTCRRVHLRRSFEVTPLQEDYRCGFCDTCQPDLNFTRDRAFTPVVLTREQELGQQFEALLERFDAEAVPDFLAACEAARVTRSFVVRSDYLLEQRPNDLSLLHLNGALHAQVGEIEQARQVAGRAAQVMRRAGLEAPGIHAHLATVEALLPGTLRGLCSAVGGPFDDVTGRPLAVQVLSLTEPATADTLRRRWALQTLTRRAAALLPDAPLPPVPETPTP